MSLETDLLVDRRRMRRRLNVWRAIAVAAVVGCALLLAGPAVRVGAGAHLARVSVTGLITENRRLTEAVAALARDDRVRAVIVFIDSPGGSVAGGESLHGALARVAEAKPVVAVMGGTAASAGYMIAVPASRIFAREATLTGSIGVLLQTGQVADLLSRIGVGAETIVSGPLKDQPGLTHPLSAEGRVVLQGLVMDMYEQFVAMVASGRHMDAAEVRKLADGRAYTGRQALGLGLVDAIGGEAEARAWLAREKGVPESLPVTDVRVGSLAERAFAESFAPLVTGVLKSLVAQGLNLDGVWAVWQPSNPAD